MTATPLDDGVLTRIDGSYRCSSSPTLVRPALCSISRPGSGFGGRGPARMAGQAPCSDSVAGIRGGEWRQGRLATAWLEFEGSKAGAGGPTETYSSQSR